MKVVSEDVVSAMDRWQAAFKLCRARGATDGHHHEFQLASLALSAALDEDGIPADQRSDVERWASEGGPPA